MEEFDPKIRIKPLKRKSDASKFDLFKAALEWSLIDPIILEKESDFKSKKDWQDKVQPGKYPFLKTACTQVLNVALRKKLVAS